MEYNVKYSEWILDTIDQLRKRKARPDLERICHMVERKHGPSFADIAAQLDKLVEAQVVVKVDYKGSTSYRNAAKWRKSHFGAVQNAASTTNKLVAAFRALGGWPAPVAEPGAAVAGASGDGSNLPGPGLENGNVSGNQSLNGDGLEAGGDSTAVNGLSLIVDKPPKSPMPISRESIEQWLLEQDPETNLIGDTLSVALEREVEAYTLEKVSDGAYMMGDPSKKPPPPEPKEKNKEKKTKAKTEKKPPSEKKPKPKKIAAEGSAPQSGTSTTENTPVKTVKPDPIKTEEIKIEIPEATEFKITEHPSTPVKTTPVKEVKVKEEKSALSPKKGRPISGKRKRIRKSHGPEFEESFTPPRAKERRRISADTRSSHSREQVEEDDVDEEVAEVNEAPASSAVVQKEPRCDYCLFSARCNKQGAAEELLFCKDCQGKAHPSCMNYSAALARRARNSPWQCIECKTCYICTESRDPFDIDASIVRLNLTLQDNMLFCDACDKGYHTDCHDPPIKSKPTGKWVCTKCQMELGVEEYMEIDESAANGSEGIGASGPITPSESPLTFEHDRPKFSKSESTAKLNGSTAGVESTSVSGSLLLPRLADTLTADVPDATNWTIEDVVNFFSDKGFTQWAEVFSEQEIDGRSLLLMKRSDVLQGLGLKLGPAIKIFAHVQRLQTRGQIAL